MACVVGATLAFGGSIEASTPRFGKFARPSFEPETPAPILDLARGWKLSEIGEFTDLAADDQICREALSAIGISWNEAVSRSTQNGCGYEAAVDLPGALSRFSAPTTMTCPLAARLYLWELQVVAPAADKYLGTPVTRMDVLGTYSCRKVAGTQHLSEHAFGKAIDIAGFRTDDGRNVSVLKSYREDSAEGRFLREIRRGACGLFNVTLGPDFNLDHANHFHLDVGDGYACH